MMDKMIAKIDKMLDLAGFGFYMQDGNRAKARETVAKSIADLLLGWTKVEEGLPEPAKGVYYLCTAVGHHSDYQIVCAYHGPAAESYAKYPEKWIDRYGNWQLVTRYQEIQPPGNE